MDKRKDPSRGLGDTVKRVIETITGGKMKPCGGCKKRQEALNRMIPYSKQDQQLSPTYKPDKDDE